MTTFWAGPCCTHFLAMLGAEVIHVESTRRPDGTRLIAGIPITEDQWWEKSPIFAALNTNKKGLTLDLQSPRGRELLRRLIATCDVIVENFTPRVLDQIGLDFAAVQAIRPDAVMLRMPGFGLDGPWRDNPAFAYAIESASGLSWLTGYPDRPPYEPYSIGDPNAGVHALNALLLALEHRRRTGQGVLVEAAMVDAALNISAEQIIEYSAYGALLERAGNRGPTAAPQNLYRTADIDEFGRLDSWVAIAVANRRSVGTALRARSDHPRGQPIPSCRRQPAGAHTRISSMSSWPRGVSTAAATTSSQRLWDAGVPVAKVMQPHRQTEIAPVGISWLLRRLRSPGERPGQAQHRAGEVLRRARPVPHSSRAAARAAQPRAAGRARPDRVPRSPTWKPTASSARARARRLSSVTPPVAGLVLERLVNAVESPAD